VLNLGGTTTPELILDLETLGGDDFFFLPNNLVLGCDGHAYLSLSRFVFAGPTGAYQSLLVKVDPATGEVKARREGLPGYAGETTAGSLAFTCRTQEIWGTTSIFDQRTRAEVWRADVKDDFGPPNVVVHVGAAEYHNMLAIAPGGNLNLGTGDRVSLVKRDAVASCTPGGTSLPACVPTPAPLTILPDTTRWRPQREAAEGVKDIQVVFSGPEDLEKAELTIEGPSDVPKGQVALPSDYKPTYTEPFDPTKKTSNGNYQLVWNGPWTIPGPEGKQVALPRGSYTLTIKGTKKNSTKEIPSDPYKDVSLVEVSKVELFADDQDPRGELTGNPEVLAIAGQNPPQERKYLDAEGQFQGGKRIFAEAQAPGGTVLNRVKVVATIEPKVPVDVPVNFQLLDVDDPADTTVDKDGDSGAELSDNRGTAKGVSTTPVTAKDGKAETSAEVSTQPGDNYRVIASTSSSWLPTVKAVQPSRTGAVFVGEEAKGNFSEMLTVWRTLHVETESMLAVPTGAFDPERNFLQGRITAIYDVRREGPRTRRPRGMRLLVANPTPGPEPPAPGAIQDLADGSPDLTSGGGNGRFEEGTIRIGTGDGVIVAGGLMGNGANFVERFGGFLVPFTLKTSAGGTAVTGEIMEWDAQARKFTLGAAIGRPIYDGGTMSIAGVNWTVASARGLTVTVVEDSPLSFHLVDDDTATAPFNPSFGLLATSDDSKTNPMAQAYIRPVRDVASPKPAAFLRNVSTPQVTNPGGATGEDTTEPIQQLCEARDQLSDTSFWLVYLQGAFQGDERRDRDPTAESVAPSTSRLGTTYNFTDPATDKFLVSVGSFIYVETIRDAMRAPTTSPNCLNVVVTHELAHQCGVGHGPGIMDDSLGCNAPPYFSADDLAYLRDVRAPGPVSRLIPQACRATP
jgi:hypothetical protein